MFVAIAKITLSIPKANSLKSKRQVVHRVLDKVKARFNVSIAETGDLDLWQKATLGITAVANEHSFAQECVSKVVRFIEELYVAPIVACSTEVIALGGELYGDDDGTSFGSVARGAHRTLAEAEAEADSREKEDFCEEPRRRFTPSFSKDYQLAKEEDTQQLEQAKKELIQRLRTARRNPPSSPATTSSTTSNNKEDD